MFGDLYINLLLFNCLKNHTTCERIYWT
jgi:hypothetical protein